MQIKLNSLYLPKTNQPKSLKIREQKIDKTAQVKNLGVITDKKLNYQTEVKNLLSKMVQSIKCLYNLTAYQKIHFLL